MKNSKSKQGANPKASVANLLAMYAEATTAKSECEKKFLTYMQEQSTKSSGQVNPLKAVVQELKRQLEQADLAMREHGEKAKQQQAMILSGVVAEKDALQRDMDDRNATITKLREAYTQSKEELRILKDELSVAAQLFSTTEETHRLSSAALQQENEKLQKELDEINQTSHAQQLEIQTLTNAFDHAQEQNRLLTERDSLLRAELALKDHTIQSTHERYLIQIEETQAQLSKINDAFEEQSRNSEQVKSKYSDIAKQNQQLHKEVEDLVKEIQRLNDEVLTKLHSDNNVLNDEIRSSRTLLDEARVDLQDRIKGLEAELAEQQKTYQARIDKAEEHLREFFTSMIPKQTNHVEQDEACITIANEDLSNLTKQFESGESMTAVIQKTKDDISHLVERLHAVQNERNKSESEVASLAEKLQMMAAQYEKLVHESDKTAEQLQSAQHSLVSAEHELVVAKNHIIHLEEELQIRNDAIQTLHSQQEQQVDQLKQEITALKHTIEIAEKEATANVESLLTQHQTIEQKLHGEIDSLNEALHQKQIHITEMMDKIQAAESTHLTEAAHLRFLNDTLTDQVHKRDGELTHLQSALADAQRLLQEEKSETQALKATSEASLALIHEKDLKFAEDTQLLNQDVLELRDFLKTRADELEYKDLQLESIRKRYRENVSALYNRIKELSSSVTKNDLDEDDMVKASLHLLEQFEVRGSSRPSERKIATMNGSIRFLMKNHSRGVRNSTDQQFLSKYLRSSDSHMHRPRTQTQIVQTTGNGDSLNRVLDQDSDHSQEEESGL